MIGNAYVQRFDTGCLDCSEKVELMARPGSQAQCACGAVYEVESILQRKPTAAEMGTGDDTLGFTVGMSETRVTQIVGKAADEHKAAQAAGATT